MADPYDIGNEQGVADAEQILENVEQQEADELADARKRWRQGYVAGYKSVLGCEPSEEEMPEPPDFIV